MWNMSESDKRYYGRKSAHDEKRNRALAKARNRGDAAAKWLLTNILTRETQPEFNRVMKQADKDFETQKPKHHE